MPRTFLGKLQQLIYFQYLVWRWSWLILKTHEGGWMIFVLIVLFGYSTRLLFLACPIVMSTSLAYISRWSRHIQNIVEKEVPLPGPFVVNFTWCGSKLVFCVLKKRQAMNNEEIPDLSFLKVIWLWMKFQLQMALPGWLKLLFVEFFSNNWYWYRY